MRASAQSRGYGAKWEAARKEHLAQEPHCRRCKRANRTVAATFVDHIVPHRGDIKLFWNRRNWQSLCSTCANGDKQTLEKSGKDHYRGCGEDGTPLDPAHPWKVSTSSLRNNADSPIGATAA